MNRAISIFLLFVGLLWCILASLLFLMLGGASEPAFIGKGLLYYSWMFAGPFLLIAGCILSLRRTQIKAGAILTAAGCLTLTVLVGYHSIQLLRAEPLQAKPPYGVYILALTLTLLSDLGACRLYFTAVSAAGAHRTGHLADKSDG